MMRIETQTIRQPQDQQPAIVFQDLRQAIAARRAVGTVYGEDDPLITEGSWRPHEERPLTLTSLVDDAILDGEPPLPIRYVGKDRKRILSALTKQALEADDPWLRAQSEDTLHELAARDIPKQRVFPAPLRLLRLVSVELGAA